MILRYFQCNYNLDYWNQFIIIRRFFSHISVFLTGLVFRRTAMPTHSFMELHMRHSAEKHESTELDQDRRQKLNYSIMSQHKACDALNIPREIAWSERCWGWNFPSTQSCEWHPHTRNTLPHTDWATHQRRSAHAEQSGLAQKCKTHAHIQHFLIGWKWIEEYREVQEERRGGEGRDKTK